MVSILLKRLPHRGRSIRVVGNERTEPLDEQSNRIGAHERPHVTSCPVSRGWRHVAAVSKQEPRCRVGVHDTYWPPSVIQRQRQERKRLPVRSSGSEHTLPISPLVCPQRLKLALN